MEKIIMRKNSPRYGFKKGDEFTVKRNINGKCVIIREDSYNLIWDESKAKSYGELIGKPQLYFG